MSSLWRSRLVGQADVPPDQLLANPLNFRIHPQAQQDALAGVLDSVGVVDRILVNRRTGHVIDGHLRVSLALQRDEPTVPVEYVDLDEQEEKLILATFDPLAAMAVTDEDQLGRLLAEVETENAAIASLLLDLAAQGGAREMLGALPDATDAGQGLNYSRKIEVPIYEPQGPCPAIQDVYETGRTRALIAAIEATPGVPTEVRAFLCQAAQRHTVFYFDKIAEYYSAASPEVQRLMEDSALVIIDVDRAIEQGFVQLTQAIAEQVHDEYGD